MKSEKCCCLKLFLFLVILFLSFPPTLYPQTDSEINTAFRAHSPLSSIMTLPLQNNTTFGYGEQNKTANILNIQPVYITKFGNQKWLSITRFIIPIYLPVPDLSSESGDKTTGFGDMSYSTWVAPPGKNGFRFGFGYYSIWPTASNEIWGYNKFSLGPSFVFVYDRPEYILGTIISQWWSISGSKNAANVSGLNMQYFISYLLHNNWYLASSPIIYANWMAETGQQWLVPFGGGAGKIFSIGKLPMDIQLQAFYYAVSPDWGPAWELRTQLRFIFAKHLKSPRKSAFH